MQNVVNLVSYQSGHPYSPAFMAGDYPIQWYGILYALGIIFACGFILAKLRFYHKVETAPFYIYIFIAVPCIIFGARAWSYVIGDTPAGTPFFSFSTGFAGLAVQGGVIFTAIAGLIWFGIILAVPRYAANVSELVVRDGRLIRQEVPRRISMWVFADTIIPAILIGQAIGRWGNFLNHEVYGDAVQQAVAASAATLNPNDTPFATFAAVTDITADPNGPAFTQWGWLRGFMPLVWDNMWIDGAFREPTFLIESFFNVVFFCLIFLGADRVKNCRAGTGCGLYFLATGMVRLPTELVRDARFQHETSVVTSSLFLAFGAALTVAANVPRLLPALRDKRVLYRATYWLWAPLLGWLIWFGPCQRRANQTYVEFLRARQRPFRRSFEELFYFNDTVELDPYDPAKRRRSPAARLLPEAPPAGEPGPERPKDDLRLTPRVSAAASAPKPPLAQSDAVHAATVALARRQDPDGKWARPGAKRAWDAVRAFAARHDFWVAVLAVWSALILLVGVCVGAGLGIVQAPSNLLRPAVYL